MSRYTQDLGKRGEKIAEQFLRNSGYKILTRNFSCRLGEIDIIAREGNTTVFIEVRTKAQVEFGWPHESIKQDKIAHLSRSAQFYINRYANPDAEFRFDVVSIVLGERVQLQLIKDAF